MSSAGRFAVKVLLLLGLPLLMLEAEATFRRGLGAKPDGDNEGGDSGQKVFSIDSYGATADGDTNNEQAFMKAWVAACKSSSPARLVIPKGTYVTGPVIFEGPCESEITVDVQGTVKATTDISDYSEQKWFLFQSITGLTVTGGGTFDGQGESAWKYNDCKSNSNCELLPTSLTFMHVKNAEISGITSLNSKSFHLHVTLSDNIKVHDITVTAPEDSPNTDGLHVSFSSAVDISSSTFGTGDDCVSIGQGTTQLSVSDVQCGPGHGISIGSLGKYSDEKDVSGIVVSRCTLKGTMYGVRIKTWEGCDPSKASDITFEDITMDAVKNPIIIDQKYGSHSNEPSQVAISNVRYRNIKGTSATNVAVTLDCSTAVPCQGLELVDIDLQYEGEKEGSSVSSECQNAKMSCEGKQNPPVCHN